MNTILLHNNTINYLNHNWFLITSLSGNISELEKKPNHLWHKKHTVDIGTLYWIHEDIFNQFNPNTSCTEYYNIPISEFYKKDFPWISIIKTNDPYNHPLYLSFTHILSNNDDEWIAHHDDNNLFLQFKNHKWYDIIDSMLLNDYDPNVLLINTEPTNTNLQLYKDSPILNNIISIYQPFQYEQDFIEWLPYLSEYIIEADYIFDWMRSEFYHFYVSLSEYPDIVIDFETEQDKMFFLLKYS